MGAETALPCIDGEVVAESGDGSYEQRYGKGDG